MANLIIKLVNGYFLLADDQPHVDCQDQVSALWSNQQAWTRRSILDVAPIGKFSFARSIGKYCEQIWNVKAVHVEER
jgi:starch phosphorylase